MYGRSIACWFLHGAVLCAMRRPYNTIMPTQRSSGIWLIFGLVVMAAAALAFSGITWAGWRPATCMADGCFCEAIHAGTIAQPVNTYTNLAFVLVGLLILNATQRGGESPFMQQRAYGYTFGGAVVLIGLGSLFYHASLSFVGQWFDVMGMYLLITFMLLYDVARLRTMNGRRFALIYVLVNIALGLLLVFIPEVRRQVFALLVVLTLALEVIIWRLRRPNIRYAWLLAAVITFAAAYGIWLLDNSRMLCAPEGLLQGHAVWHVLSALAAGMVFVYYTSQMPQAIRVLRDNGQR
jgi:hypothetical protein